MVGRPHKGDRVLLQSRPAREVWYAVRIAASEAGVSVSQYVADLLAQHVGRPDLVRELDNQRRAPAADAWPDQHCLDASPTTQWALDPCPPPPGP